MLILVVGETDGRGGRYFVPADLSPRRTAQDRRAGRAGRLVREMRCFYLGIDTGRRRPARPRPTDNASIAPLQRGPSDTIDIGTNTAPTESRTYVIKVTPPTSPLQEDRRPQA
ncbi:hypothetical protein EVAR_68889_1 [Eumeta japonica]|uniref:Uncharacterized protein n=1 Tax=Eumeta variegata TaxID=151549 RepID=A0A4C1ZTM8_EUMVA|nr:hypothetical protein EVAR_68889_1 [Eumeta japonica]